MRLQFPSTAEEFSIKLRRGLTFFIRISLVVAIVSSAVGFRWLVLFLSALTFALTFVPELFKRRFRIVLPLELEFMVVIFIYATLFLGEVHDYYTRFWWWDAVLHAGSGVALGLIGFLIMYVLAKSRKVMASPLWIVIFSFSFAVAIGAIWEIFEFTMDSLFGLNMQRSGLIDTMWDLIIDCAGALIVSVLGYLKLRWGNSPILDRMISRFEERNPGLFRQ